MQAEVESLERKRKLEASCQVVKPRLALPWETGPLKRVFSPGLMLPDYGNISVDPLPHRELARPGESQDVSMTKSTGVAALFERPLFERAMTRSNLSDSSMKRGTDREAVLRRWLCAINYDLKATKLGLLMKDGADGIDVISQTLSGKATSTILKRVRVFARMIQWSTDNGCNLFPLRISVVQGLLGPMAKAGKKSAVKDYLETINFLEHVLGFYVESGTMHHPLTKGLCREAYAQSGDIARSRALEVNEVLALERLLCTGCLDPVDRYALGVMIFQLHSGARVSDVRNIFRFIVDLDDEGNGYLEARTTDHKNSMIQSSHGAVLILVAPVRGLYERSWGHAFIASAAAVGFDLRAGHRGPMLPRLNAFNDFTTEAVGPAEVSKWLCLLVERGTGAACAPGLTSQKSLQMALEPPCTGCPFGSRSSYTTSSPLGSPDESEPELLSSSRDDGAPQFRAAHSDELAELSPAAPSS